MTTGVVSEFCYPYISGTDGLQRECPFFEGKKQCIFLGEYRKFKAKNHYYIYTIYDAHVEIMKNGPIQASFIVYRDFFGYKGGLYVWDGVSEQVGIHSARVLGWGVENGVDYFLCANSWGPKWGENGYFRIPYDQAKIITEMNAGLPSLEFD
jgi:cathepsin B